MTEKQNEKISIKFLQDQLKVADEILADSGRAISNLRTENREMRLRLNMFDNIMSLINRNDPRGGLAAQHEDIVWKIENHLRTK